MYIEKIFFKKSVMYLVCSMLFFPIAGAFFSKYHLLKITMDENVYLYIKRLNIYVCFNNMIMSVCSIRIEISNKL